MKKVVLTGVAVILLCAFAFSVKFILPDAEEKKTDSVCDENNGEESIKKQDINGQKYSTISMLKPVRCRTHSRMFW